VDVFPCTEIAEAGVPILNSFSADQLTPIGEPCRLRPARSVLDLGCERASCDAVGLARMQ
jgi:hypothetical protein